MTRTTHRRSIAGLILALLLPPALGAAPDHQRYYKTGMTAAESGHWSQVDQMMRQAIAGKTEEKRRRTLRRGGYFPHYYLGLARYHLGDCVGALVSWAESERQGAIVGRDEFNELLRRREDCQQNGSPTSGSDRESGDGGFGDGGSGDADSRAGGSSDGVVKSGSTGKEKVRTGQHWIEKGADPSRKAFGALERVGPAGSDVAEIGSKGQKLVDVAESATDIVDLAMPPEQRLEVAIDAYFAGNPSRTLAYLDEIDVSDPRGRSQVHLFRAAAHFRLHLVAGGNQGHLNAARAAADQFQQAQWRKDFPTEFFDPRFVRFVRGGS